MFGFTRESVRPFGSPAANEEEEEAVTPLTAKQREDLALPMAEGAEKLVPLVFKNIRVPSQKLAAVLRSEIAVPIWQLLSSVPWLASAIALVGVVEVIETATGTKQAKGGEDNARKRNDGETLVRGGDGRDGAAVRWVERPNGNGDRTDGRHASAQPAGGGGRPDGGHDDAAHAGGVGAGAAEVTEAAPVVPQVRAIDD